MADITKRFPGDSCEDGGERGERGKRGKRGHRGRDAEVNVDGVTIIGNGRENNPLRATGAVTALQDPAPVAFWPEFPTIAPGENITVTIFANQAGDDAKGVGTAGAPFRSFARAMLAVQPVIPPGYRVIVDITNLGLETLPQDWTCPPIRCSQEHLWDFLGFDPKSPPYFSFVTPLTVRAIPQLVASATPNQIGNSDGATVTSVGPNLVKVHVPGANWGVDSLKGKFAVKSLSPGGIPVIVGGVSLFYPTGAGAQTIYHNTADELFLCATIAAFNNNLAGLDLQVGEFLQIMEPSAILEAPPADQAQKEPIEFGGLDAINFQGIQFQSTAPINTGSGSLLIDTVTNPGLELCVLNESTYQGCRGLGIFFSACTMRGLFDGYDVAGFCQNSFFEGVGTSLNFPSFRVFGQGMPFFQTVFDGCSSFGGAQPDIFGDTTLVPVAWQFQNCLLIRSIGDALTVRSPTRVDMQTVEVDGATPATPFIGSGLGNGITATGPCQLILNGVTTDPTNLNAGVGVQTDDGAHVVVDSVTASPTGVIGTAGAFTNGDAATALVWPGGTFSNIDTASLLPTLSRIARPV